MPHAAYWAVGFYVLAGISEVLIGFVDILDFSNIRKFEALVKFFAGCGTIAAAVTAVQFISKAR